MLIAVRQGLSPWLQCEFVSDRCTAPTLTVQRLSLTGLDPLKMHGYQEINASSGRVLYNPAESVMLTSAAPSEAGLYVRRLLRRTVVAALLAAGAGPIAAAAVGVSPHRAVAISGPSQSGKTSILLGLASKGYSFELIANDTVYLDGSYMVGLPTVIELRPEAIPLHLRPTIDEISLSSGETSPNRPADGVRGRRVRVDPRNFCTAFGIGQRFESLGSEVIFLRPSAKQRHVSHVRLRTDECQDRIDSLRLDESRQWLARNLSDAIPSTKPGTTTQGVQGSVMAFNPAHLDVVVERIGIYISAQGYETLREA
ncbi:hypothetical protein [Parenemella sanctibonifatiensis]|uniref:hypothetical protein n=1 Tax=Parenemella sanctibonifatiensis TaxID=2016505 RepID=UPI0011848C09|nr:hypothetical protein [Parenemella sanctibonifatiensis]